MNTASDNAMENTLLTAGLSEREAALKLQQIGFNELPSAKRKSLLKLALPIIREPMIILLIACAVIYLLLGDLQEGLILSFSVLVVIAITLAQETKSERAIEALKDLSSPRALVVRDGKEIRIPGREVAPGDLAVLHEGARVPADGKLVSTSHLRVDESLLTGESVPVQKKNSARVFSGTLVVGGLGFYKVTETGAATEMGRIGRSLQTIASDKTLLQRQVTKLLKLFGMIGAGFSVLIVVLYGLKFNNWPQAFLSGIAAAISLLPEELPTIMTVFLAIGAWRISKKNVLARQVSAIENLGSISVLCVDKTGTLTQNEMTVQELNVETANHVFSLKNEVLPEVFHPIIEYGVLASHVDPFDPMEKAIRHKLEQYLANTEHVHRDWVLVKEYPLSEKLLAMSCVWRRPDTRQYTIAAKGAPEAIIDLCHLSDEQGRLILSSVQAMTERGLRVLGVAQATFDGQDLPVIQHDFAFAFVGLIGLEDPVRPEARAAVEECNRAGIRVVMMTGDYKGTAQSIARQVGLQHDVILTGAELETLNSDALKVQIPLVNVFARTMPTQKLRIVEALKASGAVVAMTGDGVNDAPSLKSADVGIAMGRRGTDVAREAADIVLLDDNFSSIVASIKLGRRIFDNIQKAMTYVFAVHLPIAGMTILPILFGMPLVLLPVHLVFLELIIDPACTLVFEAEEDEGDVMARAPRSPKNPMFGFSQMMRSIAQGSVALVLVFGYAWFLTKHGYAENAMRSLTFAALVCANLGLIVANLSHARRIRISTLIRNHMFIAVILGALTLLAVVLFVPYFQVVFGFAELQPLQFAISLALGLVTAICVRFFN